MAAPVNVKILLHPLNYAVVAAIALFWLLVFDIVARHYANNANPATAAN